MSKLIMMERDVAVTSSEAVTEQVAPEENISVENETDVTIDYEASDDALELEGNEESGHSADEAYEDEPVEDYIEGDINTEAGIGEDAYIDDSFYTDTGMYEGGYSETGMETGMVEVKDPLLSSWPFVIGISVGVLIVSIALGALLARLKIKKGIDLYED
ncbi:MAG: hypothetical protein GX271_06245 [Clostridiales bacterium]|nr:hypothetical protein [Clostridiales bacterium]